jgi:hypothetical protein
MSHRHILGHNSTSRDSYLIAKEKEASHQYPKSTGQQMCQNHD